MPEAVSDLLRSEKDLSTLIKGLMQTDIALQLNDTQGVLTQTIFAPSNAAFQKLGRKVNKFLFSPWGKPYLTAVLKYHIVMNNTLFTDALFLNGHDQTKLNMSSEVFTSLSYTFHICLIDA
jgi:uncharacterized surface protein with fasciclin (FAS1) repeats